MQEKILTLAAGITGAGEEERELLRALCETAEVLWKERLKTGMAAEACGEAFACAAAFSAAADFIACQGSGVESFKVGEISVKPAASGGGEQAAALRKSAERLMAPYAAVEDFYFKGVQG